MSYDCSIKKRKGCNYCLKFKSIQVNEKDRINIDDYENMAQSGLLSMANLAENIRQFNTGHEYAMELAEQAFAQETALTEMRNKHAFAFAALEYKYDMLKQNAKDEHELEVLDKELEYKEKELVSTQNHERIQFLESLRAPNSQAVGLPTRIQIYDTIMNRERR